LLSAILAGRLVGLLSWHGAAARDTISTNIAAWLLTTVIGFAKLHRVILGTVEVMAGLFAGQGIPISDLCRFLPWAIIGNTFGGVVLVAIVK
jgi:formate/nitrite transporter FocA (FNT family)